MLQGIHHAKVGHGPGVAPVHTHACSTVVPDMDEIHHCVAATEENVLKTQLVLQPVPIEKVLTPQVINKHLATP